VTLNDIDGKIVRALLRGQPTQAELATAIGATKSATTAALTKLQRGGVVTLHRDGQRQIPKLAVLSDVVDAFGRLERGILDLVAAIAA
jgi:DNA-binding transcriptional ArsR family regulator